MAITFRAEVAGNGQFLSGEQMYAGNDPVEFISFLRGMYGKRMKGGDRDDHGARFANGGGYMSTITLLDTAWSTMEDQIMDRLIDQWHLKPSEIRALDEIVDGGLYWALDNRKADLESSRFTVRDEEVREIKSHVCMQCAGTFMEWSRRGWSLGIKPYAEPYTCEMCMKTVGSQLLEGI